MLKELKNKLLPRSLFGRSLLIIITPVLLLQIIASIVFVDRHWSAMSSRLSDAVSGEVSMLIEQIEEIKDPKELNHRLIQFSRNVELLVTYEQQIAFPEDTSTKWWGVEKKLTETLKRDITQKFIVQEYNKDKWYEALIQFEDGSGLRILIPERRLFSSSSYIFILWLLGSSFVLFAIAAVFMRNQIRPIRKLAMAADRFGKGVDVPNFRPHGASEVRQASEAFLEMRKRIKRQIEQRTDMLSGVSHDLRTPITRMKLQLELLGDTSDAEALRHDLEDMEKMVEGYLSFARGEGDEAVEATDISAMVVKLAHAARREGKNVTEDIKPGEYTCRIRPHAIERCINNLINNACKYGESAWVYLKQDEDAIEIAIEDDGPGIPATSYKEVFKPFFRMDKSRNTQSGGVGLGLSIANDIIHNHGGCIKLSKSRKHRGLRALVRLPL